MCLAIGNIAVCANTMICAMQEWRTHWESCDAQGSNRCLALQACSA